MPSQPANQPSMQQPCEYHMYTPGLTKQYRVLIANDREKPEEPDAWKYKVVAPNSTWSLGFDTWRQAYDEARADVRRG